MVAEHRNALRRRETFHHVVNQRLVPSERQEILPDIRSRRGSFDGLFYVAECSGLMISSSEPSAKPKGTTVYIGAKSERKLKSKSLDRIGDGLDSLVDIVLTSETRPDSKDTKLRPPSVVIVSRSPSNRQREFRPQLRDEPVTKYPSDRSLFLPVQRNPSPTELQKFVLKRGHTNAGLYSGHHNIRDSPGKAVTSDYYSRGLNSLHHINLSISAGKLMDLPSGLY